MKYEGRRYSKEWSHWNEQMIPMTKTDVYSSYYAQILAYLTENRLVATTLVVGSNEELSQVGSTAFEADQGRK